VDNFYISHSEKDFLGGGGEGKRRVVHYRGTVVVMRFGLHCK
jgi:hypothetical protein